jgi:hypothetical protein
MRIEAEELKGIFREQGHIFGPEWDEVRRQQIEFLAERPLIFKVRTQEIWGPADLQNLWTEEWKELVGVVNHPEKGDLKEELADMVILLLTLDSIKPDLMVEPQRGLIEICLGIVKKYADDLGLGGIETLIPVAGRKIEINKLRNPPEAFGLVQGEEMSEAEKRLENNWRVLKSVRDRVTESPDWWKQWVGVDEGGWMKEGKMIYIITIYGEN